MPSLQCPTGTLQLLGVNRPVVPRVDWGAAQVNRDHAHYPPPRHSMPWRDHGGCQGRIGGWRAVVCHQDPFHRRASFGLDGATAGRECKRYRACPMLIALSHLGLVPMCPSLVGISALRPVPRRTDCGGPSVMPLAVRPFGRSLRDRAWSQAWKTQAQKVMQKVTRCLLERCARRSSRFPGQGASWPAGIAIRALLLLGIGALAGWHRPGGRAGRQHHADAARLSGR